jgi:hypothetical protein
MAKKYPVFDKGRPERPSSSKHDAVVNPRNTGSVGGKPYPKPIPAPDMSKVER